MVVILFDLEGTLVQSIESNQEAILEFRSETRKKLLSLGIPPKKLEGVIASTLMRNIAFEYVEENFSEEELKRFHDELDEFLKNYELRWAGWSRIFLDTVPSLQQLKETGYKMGVVTNTSREAANRILSAHELRAFFDVIVTREDVKKLKPDPQGIRFALEKLKERYFFFIGDLVHDARAAEKAGGFSININRGAPKKLKFHADYRVRSLTEIPHLIQRIECSYRDSGSTRASI